MRCRKNVTWILTASLVGLCLAPHSFLCTISPGVTATDWLVLDQAQVNHLIVQTPLSRLGQPTDAADAVAMLSDDARWIMVQYIGANGVLPRQLLPPQFLLLQARSHTRLPTE